MKELLDKAADASKDTYCCENAGIAAERLLQETTVLHPDPERLRGLAFDAAAEILVMLRRTGATDDMIGKGIRDALAGIVSRGGRPRP